MQLKNFLILPFICCSLSSCSNSSNKIHLTKVHNITTAVCLEQDTLTTNYHFSRSTFILYISLDNKNLDETINNYVESSSNLIYRLSLEDYNEIATTYNEDNQETIYPVISDNNAHLLFVQSSKVIKNQSLNKDSNLKQISKIVTNNTIDTKIYNMNIDVNYKKTINGISYIVENDETNTNIIYKDGELNKDFFDNSLGQFENNENKLVLFSRLSCGDCRNLHSKVLDEYFQEHLDKSYYNFDLFIFEYYKGTEDQQKYDDSREFVKNILNVGFNYYEYDLETKANPVKTETLEFRFPTLAVFKKTTDSIEKNDLIIYSNDTITQTSTDDNSIYYVEKSFYNDKELYSFASSDYESVKSQLEKYQKEKVIYFLNTYTK